MITLRDYKTSDIQRLVFLANHKNVSQYLVTTFPYPYTQQDAEYWIEIGSKENGSICKVIEYWGEFVGSVGITPQMGWKDHSTEIGYWLGEAYWGSGIATQAVNTMSHIALRSEKCKKIFAPVLDPNKASMRVLEKCGFKLEGVLKREVYKDQKYFDIYHYAKAS